MNHQYFKDWLTSEEPLTLKESQILEDHVIDCVSCQQLKAAWSDVNHFIKVAPDVEPLPGFSSRWVNRLHQQQKKAQKRLTWVVFATLAGFGIFVMFLLGIQLFEFIRSPEQIAVVFISRFAVMISYLTITKDYLSLFSNFIPKMSLPMIVFAFGMMTLLCVIWLATMRQISRVWRIVK